MVTKPGGSPRCGGGSRHGQRATDQAAGGGHHTWIAGERRSSDSVGTPSGSQGHLLKLFLFFLFRFFRSGTFRNVTGENKKKPRGDVSVIVLSHRLALDSDHPHHAARRPQVCQEDARQEGRRRQEERRQGQARRWHEEEGAAKKPIAKQVATQNKAEVVVVGSGELSPCLLLFSG